MTKPYFWVGRDKDGSLTISMGKLLRKGIFRKNNWCPYKSEFLYIESGIVENQMLEQLPDIKSLKWEDSPIKLYISTEEG